MAFKLASEGALSVDALSEGSPGPGAFIGPHLSRFGWTALYFVLVLAAGAVGYRFLEGWSWLDSLYMAVITVTAVGFGEVQPLTDMGRVFTMVLVIGGITSMGVWWALITAFIVELDLGGMVRRRRMIQRVEELQEHFVVCGAGRMGKVLIAEVLSGQDRVVVVERDPDSIAQLHELYPDLPIIEGDATKENTLQAAQIDRAKGLVCCLADDADNLLLVLTARVASSKLVIVARATDEEALSKMRRAGADHVVSPNVTGAVRMAAALMRPSVVTFLDAATIGDDINLRLEEARLPASSSLIGKTLADARIPQRTGLIVLAVRPEAGKPQFNPGPETQLQNGDVMIVLGRPEQIDQLRTYVGG